MQFNWHTLFLRVLAAAPSDEVGNDRTRGKNHEGLGATAKEAIAIGDRVRGTEPNVTEGPRA